MSPRSYTGEGVSRQKSPWASMVAAARPKMVSALLLGLLLVTVPLGAMGAQAEPSLELGAPLVGPDWVTVPVTGLLDGAIMRLWCQAKDERAEVVRGSELRAATLPLELQDRVTREVTFKGLLPQTTYYIYCYAEDESVPAHVMPDSAIVAGAKEAQTTKGSTFRAASWPASLTTHVPVGPLSVRVPFRGSALLVSASLLSDIASADGCSAAGVAGMETLNRTAQATVSPAESIRMTGEPDELTGTFSLTAHEAGCYEVVYDVIGAPSELQEENLPMLPLDYIWVADLGSAPHRAPAPLRAQLLGTGTQVAVTFDMPTDRQSRGLLRMEGEEGNCLPQLSFEGAKGAVCTWVNASTVVITPDHASPLLPGAALTVSGLRPQCPLQQAASAYCQALPHTADVQVVVEAHQQPLYPVPVISYASLVSLCDGITVVGSGSHGSGGLNMFYHWTVVRERDMVTPDNIVSYLMEINPLPMRPSVTTLRLPKELLEAGETYRITLSLQNFLELTADSKTAVIKVAEAKDPEEGLPRVRILGGGQLRFKTSEAIDLRAEAEVSSCRQRILPPLLSYSWSCVDRPTLSSSSADPRRFRLEPGTLPPGTYLFAVSVTSDIGGPNAEASVTVVVEPSPLVVLVAGGDRRTLGQSDSLTLDASASFDPDRPREPVALRWSCLMGGERYGESCIDVVKAYMIANASITLPPLANGTYLFTVQASSLDIKAAGYQQKSARHVVTVDVVEAPSVPYVAITSPRVKVNPSTRLVLSGVVDGSAPQVAHLLAADGQARWTIVDGPLTTGELSALSATVTASAFTRDLPMASLSLILPPNTLPPIAGTYTFHLATYNTGLSRQGSADVVVSVNGAPFGGSVIADPPAGQSLNTLFKLSTSGWTDDEEDFPLHYTFGVRRGQDEYTLDARRWEEVMTDVTLPQGEVSSDYVITVVAYASDRYNASSSAEVPVKVSPSEIKSGAELLLSAKVAAAAANSLVEKMHQWLLAVGVNLNSAMCGVTNPDESLGLASLVDKPNCDTLRLLLITTLGQAVLLQDPSPEVLGQQVAALRLLTVPIESVSLTQTEAAFRVLQPLTHRLLAAGGSDRRTIAAAADIFDVLLGMYGSNVDLFTGPPLSDTAYLLATAAAEGMVPGEPPLIVARRNVNMTVLVDVAYNFRSRTLRPTPDGDDASHATDSAMAVTLPPSGLDSLYPSNTPLHRLDVIRSATLSLPNLHKWTQTGNSVSNVLRVYLDKEDYHGPPPSPTLLQTPLPVVSPLHGERRRRRMSASVSAMGPSNWVNNQALVGRDKYVMVVLDKRRAAPTGPPELVLLHPNNLETQAEASRVEEVVASCAWGEQGSKTVGCPTLDGNVTIECVGMERNETWQCVASASPQCVYWDGIAWVDAGCHVVQQSDVSVMCMCEDFVSVLGNTSDGNAGEYVVTMLDMALVNINSTQVLLASTMSGTVLSAKAAANHLPLLLSLGILLVLGLFLAYLSYSHDEALRIVSMASGLSRPSALLDESRRRLMAARSRPLSARLRGGWLLLKAELSHRRDTFSLAIAGAGHLPWALRALLLITSLLATMSVAAALYGLYLPTNFHCSQHRVQHDCLSEHSVFYPDYTVCLWDHNFRTCMYKPPQPSFLGVVLLCAAVTAIMCIFNRLLKDGLFDSICPPPSEGSQEDRDEELDGSNPKDALVVQVPEVADRILESAKKQRWELLQHIETLQTKARLHLGSRPASSLTHSDSETEEVLWHRNVSQAAGGSGPTSGSAKGPTDAKAAAPTKPKGTGAVIHRRSRLSKWLSPGPSRRRAVSDDAGMVVGSGLGLSAEVGEGEDERSVEDELLLLMEAVAELEATWHLDEQGAERRRSTWEWLTGTSFRTRLQDQVRQDLSLCRRLQQDMRELGPGPAQELRLLEYSRLDFVPAHERLLYLRNRAEMLPPRDDDAVVGPFVRVLLLLGVVMGDVLLIAYLGQYGSAGVSLEGEGSAGGWVWLCRVLAWPLLYMAVQQLLLFAPLAAVFYGAYMPLHVQRTIRTEVRKAQESLFVPSTDMLLGPGCLTASRQRQLEASRMILLSRPSPTPANEAQASSGESESERAGKERAARKALRARYLEFLDSYPRGPSDSHLLFRLCYHSVRGLAQLPSWLVGLAGEVLALPLFVGLFAYLLQLLYVAQAGALVAPLAVALGLLLWALWSGAGANVVAFETLPGTPCLGPQGLPEVLLPRKAVAKLGAMGEERDD